MTRGDSKKLRGPKLEAAAIQELKIWPRNKALTWQMLAELFGVKRQALMAKPEVRREYERCKLTIFDVTQTSRRRDHALGSAEKEIAYLRAENDRLRVALEKAQLCFACVEHNAMLMAIDVEKLWSPIDREAR
jgi:hypothetical protein